jgi:hypothetical protein
MRKYILIFPLIVILFASCSLSKFGWKTENEAKSPSPESKGIVEDWDPLSVKEEEYTVVPSDAAAPIASSSAASKTPSSSSALDGEEENQVPGFRIQILSTSSETAARDEKSKAMLRFNQKVYLVFDAQYKVRVGDFLTYEEAKPLRELAVQKGYADAFIVRTQVNKPASTSPQ